MVTEYEICFLDTPHDEIREKIITLWGECTMDRTFMRRIVFRNPLDPDESFARIRDEGKGKITCTYKESTNGSIAIDSVKEIECEVSDLESMRNIFVSLGIPEKSYQESYRETWKIGEVEFMLDEWPGLKPFIEIEWPNEVSVRAAVNSLGFVFEEWMFGGAGRKYEQELGIPRKVANNLPKITFDDPPEKYSKS